MSTPVPPSSPLVPTPTPASAPLTVTVVNPPQALVALTQGATVDATVLAALTKGEARVSTQFGDLILKTPLNLPQGGDLALTLLSQTRGQAVLKIAALNGRPLANAGFHAVGQGNAGQAPGQAPPPQAPAQGNETAGNRAVTVAVGGTARSGLTATVVRALPGPLPNPGGGQAVPAPPQGAQLVVRVAEVIAGDGRPGAPTPTPSTGGTLPPPPGMTTPGAAAFGPTPGQAATGKGPPQASGGVPPEQGKGQDAPHHGQPPGRTLTPATLQVLAGRTIPGTVVSSGTGAQPVIDTEIGQLALRARLNARPGDMVQLQIIGRPGGLSTAPPPATPPLPTAAPLPGQLPLAAQAAPLSGGAGWPTLSESLRLLGGTEGGAGGGNPLAEAMPKPGPGLAAAVTTFVGALRGGGDTAKWPGDPAMRALERTEGKKGAELAAKLGTDMRDMASRSTEGTGEWRSYSVPFLNGGDIDPVRVVLRRTGSNGEDDEGQGGGRGERGQRFLVEVDLTHLGPLQFDGLYKKKGRQLDMVVRARDSLPPDMRQDIQVLYNTALVTMGLTGRVQFDVHGPFTRPLGPSGHDPSDTVPSPLGSGGVVV
jgi:hypothetical protein